MNEDDAQVSMTQKIRISVFMPSLAPTLQRLQIAISATQTHTQQIFGR